MNQEIMGFEDDPFRRNNVDIRLGYQFSDAFVLNGSFNASDFENSFDAGSFGDGDNETEESTWRVSLSPEYTYENGSIQVNFAYSKFDVDRIETSFPGKSDGDNYMVDAFVKHDFGEIKLIGGNQLPKQ